MSGGAQTYPKTGAEILDALRAVHGSKLSQAISDYRAKHQYRGIGATVMSAAQAMYDELRREEIMQLKQE